MPTPQPTSPSPYQLGLAFLRVRYHFHAELFHRLSEQNPNVARLSKLAHLFDDIWLLCVRNAPPEDLNTHFPTVLDLTPQQIAAQWSTWNIVGRRSFLKGLRETLQAEAEGDTRRGRKLLAGKLYSAQVLITEMLKDARNSKLGTL